MAFIVSFLLVLTSIFLILLVLVQRGRGGGLTGALGGMGGQSAFGTKAGDLFTRITIGAATLWIVLCIASVKMFNSGRDRVAQDIGGDQETESVDSSSPVSDAPAGAVPPAEGGAAPAAAPAAPPAEGG